MKKIAQIDAQKIENEITHFEHEVDFEIAPVIAQKSSYTDHVRLLFSWNLMFWLGFLTFVFFQYFPDKVDDILNFLNLQLTVTAFIFAVLMVAVIFVIYYVCQFDFIQRLYISKDQMRKQVQEKAKMIFFEKRLNELKSKNAILIYISVLERRIVILPDPRIDLKNLPELTQKSLEILQKHFKQSEYELGLITVIQMLKNELKVHYPRSKNTENATNEYSNKLIWWND